MPAFQYIAMDSKGKEIKGKIDSESETDAIASLKKQGFFPTSVTAMAGKTGGGAAGAKGAGKSALKNMEIKIPGFGGGKVKTTALASFTRQLATLNAAGVPLFRSLNVLYKQERLPALKTIIKKMADDIESGSTFSESVSRYPKVFNKLYVNMVKAGELGGVLELTLTRLSDFMEKAEKIKRKIKAAMFYPITVLFIAIAIMSFLMVFIVPKFQSIFAELLPGQDLPFLTNVIIGVSNIFMNHYLILIGTIGAVVVGFNVGLKFEKFRFFLDSFSLRMPLFGPLASKTAIARFTRTLGTLVTSGVPILQALNITKETAGNLVVSKAISLVHDSVKEGESVVQPLEASGVFPPMVISMIEVGEETGQLPEMLTKIADNYEDEVDNAVAGLTSLIEPLMIVVLAVIVGSIVIGMFLPLLKVIQGMSAQN